jgi:hypothetical protein
MIEYFVFSAPDELDHTNEVLSQERSTLCGIKNNQLANLVVLDDLPDIVPGHAPYFPCTIPWEVKEQILKYVFDYSYENCYYNFVRHAAKSCRRILDLIYHEFYPHTIRSARMKAIVKLRTIYRTLDLMSAVISSTGRDANYRLDKFRGFLMDSSYISMVVPYECTPISMDTWVFDSQIKLADQDRTRFLTIHAGPDSGHTVLITGAADTARNIDAINQVNIYKCENIYYPVILLGVARRTFSDTQIYHEAWRNVERHLKRVFKKLGGNPLILFRDEKRKYRELATFL